jgi:hypothetical protein
MKKRGIFFVSSEATEVITPLALFGKVAVQQQLYVKAIFPDQTTLLCMHGTTIPLHCNVVGLWMHGPTSDDLP